MNPTFCQSSPARTLAAAWLLLSLWTGHFAAMAESKTTVLYRASFEHREHHEASIEAHFRGLDDQPLLVRMSRSSPGRYALHEFAKNVYRVSAIGRDGRELRIERPDAHQWRVFHDGEVIFRYTLFGDRADGTYAQIDRNHAHLNMPATFVWAVGLEERPIEITFDLPEEGWRVSTQLEATSDPTTFAARDLQYFLDSPTEIGAHQVYSWIVEDQEIRLALHHQGTEAEALAFVAMAKAVVDEQIAIYGEAPRFDHGSYIFLADYLDSASGDGMEHRNSTVLTSSMSLADAWQNLLGTVSHEFQHAWNIERIRPASLEPFDFTRANMSEGLWFGEGFTSYYDGLAIHRAGLGNLDRWASSVGQMVDAVVNSPALGYGSPVEMSRQAPFVDAASWIDPGNRSNTFLSYYTYGAAIGLGLDLILRTRFDTTLDDYMRAVWQRHGTTEVPYRLADLQAILGEVSGDTEWAAQFFARSIHGSELPAYAELLERAGILLRPANPASAWIDPLRGRFRDGALELSQTRVGSPLYTAGLDRGDRILEIDGEPLDRRETVSERLSRLAPGDLVTMKVVLRGADGPTTLEVEAVSDPAVEAIPIEHVGKQPTPAIQQFRDSWLGAKAVGDHGARTELQLHCGTCKRSWSGEFAYCPVDGEKLRLTPP